MSIRYILTGVEILAAKSSVRSKGSATAASFAHGLGLQEGPHKPGGLPEALQVAGPVAPLFLRPVLRSHDKAEEEETQQALGS